MAQSPLKELMAKIEMERAELIKLLEVSMMTGMAHQYISDRSLLALCSTARKHSRHLQKKHSKPPKPLKKFLWPEFEEPA